MKRLITWLLINKPFFPQDSFFPVLCHFVAIAFGAFSVAWGVKSIELANCVVVPVFLVLLLFTFIWSMTLENAGAGIKFMFSPDWGKLVKRFCPTS